MLRIPVHTWISPMIPGRSSAAHLAGVLVLFLLLFPVSLAGQEGFVTGSVTSQTGEPLEDIVVSVVDTDIGVLTDAEGRYRLEIPAGDHRIEAAGMIGFASSERGVTVAAGEVARVDFVLTPRAVELSEVVVSLSATETRREEFGSDIERLNVDQEVENASVTNFSDLVMGRVTGVTISEGDGQAGVASKIRVRGATSLTQDNNPIVYVDGVRVSNETGAGPQGIAQGDGQTISRLDDLNFEDIADVQVLKGPTAAAAYGSEAASGVVVITTKRGAEGRPQFRFGSEVSTASNPTEYEANYFNLTANGGITDIDDPTIQQFDPVRNPATGDIFARHNPLEWNDPFRTGVSYNTNLSLRGGLEEFQYYGSGKYDKQNGPLTPSNSERISIRGNFSASPTSAIDLSFSSNYLESDVRTLGTGRGETNMIANAILGLPMYGFGRNPDGSEGDCMGTMVFGFDSSECTRRRGNIFTTFENLEEVVNRHTASRFIGSATLNARPTSWFSNKLVAGIDIIDSRDVNLVPLDPERPLGNRSRGQIDDARNSERIVTFDYAGTVTTTPSDVLRLSSTLGAQYIGRKRNTLTCNGRDGFAGPNATACGASVTFSTGEEIANIVEIGSYLQQTLSYQNYLFATGAVRVDDNSGFGENQGAIWSPSLNGSAVLTRMPFWETDFVSNLRLRFAWGKAAQAPGPFDAITTFAPVRSDQNGTQVLGISPEDPGNPDLRPERNEELELGLDAAFLDDRLALKATYFNQTINDAIVTRRVSPGTGFSGVQFVNIAEVANDGFEALLEARLVEEDDVSLDASLKYSTQDPIVTDLGGLPPIRGFFQMEGMIHEGYAPGSYYGPLYTSAERDENHEIVPGSEVFAEGNLNFPDNPNFRYMGRPNPTNQQSLTATLNLFNRLSVYTMFDRRAGHHRMNDTDGSRNCFIRNISGGRLCAFREAELTPAEQAALEQDVVDAPQIFVTEADFIKWRELTARYQLPPSITGRFGLGTASIAVGGRNLFTWTDYFGVDPEADISGGEDAFGNTGMYGTIAPSRYFFARLNFTF